MKRGFLPLTTYGVIETVPTVALALRREPRGLPRLPTSGMHPVPLRPAPPVVPMQQRIFRRVGGFDPLPGVVILELRGAQVAERGVQPASVVDLVNEAGIFAPNHLRGHRDRSDGSPCPAARTPRPATPAYIWHAPSPPQACAAGSAHAAEDLHRAGAAAVGAEGAVSPFCPFCLTCLLPDRTVTRKFFIRYRHLTPSVERE